MVRRTRSVLVGVLAILAAQVSSPATGDEVCKLTQIAPVRCAVWASEFDSNSEEEGTAVVVSPAGDRVFAGAFTWDVIQQGAVVAYDASDGVEKWRRVVANAPVWDVAVSGDGRTVFAAARSSGGHHSLLEHRLVALDAADGRELWSADHAEAAANNFVNRAAHVEVSPDSGVVYLGRSVALEEHGFDSAIEAHDASTGVLLWTRRFAGTALVSDMKVSNDGHTLYLTGIGDHQYQWTTTAVGTSDGGTKWTRIDSFSGFSKPWGLAVAPDDAALAVTGRQGDFETTFRTMKLDARTGSLMWAQSNDGSPVRNVFNEGFAVTFSPDGGKVFAAGTSGGNVARTIAYDAGSGDQLWAWSSGEYLGGYMYAIQTSADGRRVYVSGRISSQIDTRALDATSGVVQWIGRNRHRSGGTAYDLAVGPDGRVFVTAKGIASMITLAFDG